MVGIKRNGEWTDEAKVGRSFIPNERMETAEFPS
jgi:hypothetical protein